MVIQKFEDLIAWQKSQDFAIQIHKSFQQANDFGYKDQLLRTVISISNNIAESFDFGNEVLFSKTLQATIGTCSMIRSMLYLSFKIGIINEESLYDLIDLTNDLSGAIKKQIATLKM